MRVFVVVMICGVWWPVACSQQSQAGLITFDDQDTSGSFFALGIQNDYQGFRWGHGAVHGLADAHIPMTSYTGWAVSTVSSPITASPPTPVSGESIAATWQSVRSLFIDFQAPHDVHSSYFATFSSVSRMNASSLRLYGYDESQTLVATSDQLDLTNDFQKLTVNFSGIRYLEIRANRKSQFSVDDLDVSPTSDVPEPSSLLLLGVGSVCLALQCRRRRGSRRDRVAS